MKQFLCGLLLALLLSGCAGEAAAEQKQYNATFLTLFDTVTVVTGLADSQEAFTAKTRIIHDGLQECHQLFDIYNDYDGIHNLKTINDNAGGEPVVVDEKIIALLSDCKDFYEATDGKVNVAMGSVLQLWHVARNDGLNDLANAYLPDMEELKEAAEHTDFSAVVIDEEASTVQITDPAVRLDVGAIAKGWSTQYVCENAPTGLLVSVGGNVCATGPKDNAGTPWVVGVQDPDDGSHYLHTLYLSGGSMVTSGDYQRNYAVDGKLYHHIIDPETLYPSEYWSSVTIVCADSGVADMLSTALFLLPLERGKTLLDQWDAEAMWVDAEGEIFYSPGFRELIRT